MEPTLTIATETDAQLIGFALWDYAQQLRKAGSSDDADRAYELSQAAFREASAHRNAPTEAVWLRHQHKALL